MKNLKLSTSIAEKTMDRLSSVLGRNLDSFKIKVRDRGFPGLREDLEKGGHGIYVGYCRFLSEAFEDEIIADGTEGTDDSTVVAKNSTLIKMGGAKMESAILDYWSKDAYGRKLSVVPNVVLQARKKKKMRPGYGGATPREEEARKKHYVSIQSPRRNMQPY